MGLWGAALCALQQCGHSRYVVRYQRVRDAPGSVTFWLRWRHRWLTARSALTLEFRNRIPVGTRATDPRSFHDRAARDSSADYGVSDGVVWLPSRYGAVLYSKRQ